MEHLEQRLKAITNMQVVCRLTLSACLVISVLILLAQFNSYFSWYRRFALAPSKPTPLGSNHVEQMRGKVVEQWLSGRSFKIPFIDIPILPSDISILGGFSICIATMFLLFYMRREHFSIAHLLRDSMDAGDSIKLTVLHAVLSGFVFVSLKLFNKPYWKLCDVLPLPEISRRTPFSSYAIFYFFPFAIAVSILVDVYSYFYLVSPFRGHVPADDWYNIVDGRTEGAQFIILNLIALPFLAWASCQCFSILRYERATRSLVYELGLFPRRGDEF